MIRVVLDTNVIVSFFLNINSVAGNVVTKLLAKNNSVILLSENVFLEYKETLEKAKFKSKVSDILKSKFLLELIEVASFINPEIVITDCRDKKDNKFLELAISGDANYIITGDDDLLDLMPYKNIQILKPADFLTKVLND